jgi:hypothetical protein
MRVSRVSSVRCPSCGSAAPSAEDYCTRCGNDLTSPGLLPITDDPGERTEVIDARPVRDQLSPPRPRRRRAGPAGAVVLGIALLFAAGYAGFRVVDANRGSRAAPPPSAPATTTPTAAPRPPGSTPPPLPAETGPLVAAAPALAGRPGTTAVVALFTRYFDGINRRDYEAVQGAFTDEGRPVRDQATFEDQYRTTRDTDVRVLNIALAGDGGYQVSISFNSHQNPADAPADAPAACVHWSMTYPVVPAGTGTGDLLIAHQPAVAYHAC